MTEKEFKEAKAAALEKVMPHYAAPDRCNLPKMTLEEEIAYRSRGSYYAMWDFISNPEWQRKLKGRTDLYDKVKFMIDRAKKENYAVTSSMKRYDPSDEETFRKVLESMR